MKKILLLAIGLLFGAQGFGQEPELFGTWYLRSLNIDDTNYYPDNLSQNLDCNFSNGDLYENEFHFPNAISLETFELTIDENNQQFILGEHVGLAMGICNTQECFDFFSIYSPFYFDYVDTVMEYLFIPEPNGSLSLLVINIDGDWAAYNSEPLLGVNDFSASLFKLYPNPVQDQLFITSEKGIVNKMEVFSMTGQKILELSGNSIDVSSLSKGMYFLEITSGNNKSFRKFIKK